MKSGWEALRLCDICTLLNGRAYKQKELLTTGKYPVLRVGNFFTNRSWYYSDLELEDDKYCDEGDLLYAWSASFGPRVWHGPKAIFHYHIWKVRIDAARADKRFLLHWFDWDKERITTEQGAGTTMIHVTKGSMEDRQILVPPLPEQRRIVAILDEAFEGIAAAKANVERNLRNAREVFGGWFEETLSAIGTRSVVRPLGDVCQIQTGKKDVNEGNPSGRYPFFTCAAEPTNSDEYSFDAEAILIAGNGNVGQAQYFIGKFEAYQRTYVLTNFRGVTGAYLFRTIDKRLNQKMLQQKLGNTMPYIKMGMLQEFPIPVPDAATQASVTERAESLGAEVNRLEQRCDSRIAALDELKASLLHQAFTGQL